MARSDGSTASYYELPPESEQLQDLIAYKNMNAQVGEIFRACYRYGQVDHSDQLRDINKILFYAQAEKVRILKYGLGPTTVKNLTELYQAKEKIDREVGPTEPVPDSHPTRIKCTQCLLPIEGRIYYLGNEPRCTKHSGDRREG